MKVINLIGGPGIGKSSIAADLFALMKWNDIKVELVTEFAKDLVWEERHMTIRDQLYLFAKQNHKLYRLKGKVDYVINDSPLLLVLAYQPKEYYVQFEPFVREVWDSYTNINISLNRAGRYQPEGRIHDEQQALYLDNEIRSLFANDKVEMVNADQNARSKILQIILENQNKQLSFDFTHSTKQTQMDVILRYIEKHPGLREPVKDRAVQIIDHSRLEEHYNRIHADPDYPSA